VDVGIEKFENLWLDELFEMLTSPFSQNKSGSPKLSDKLPTCILSRKP